MNPQNTLNLPWPFCLGEGPLWAILDAASIPGLLGLFQQSQTPQLCLYTGSLNADLASAAPYIARIDQPSPLADRLFLELWDRHPGIYFFADADLHALRRHFRQFTIVYAPGAKPVYFRFYDPRVLRTYLPTCSTPQLRRFFGPVRRFLCEDQKPATSTILSFTSNALSIDRLPNPRPGSAA